MRLEALRLEEGFWYLATPYSKYPTGLEMAWTHACDAAGELLKRRVHLYCPIAHTHPIAAYGGLDPLDHDRFMDLDARFMDAAYGLLVVTMPTWEESVGIQMEIDAFEAKFKPVLYLDWPVLAVQP